MWRDRGQVDYLGGDEMLRLVQGMFLSSGATGLRQVVFCGVASENGSSPVCASVGRMLAANSTGSVCLVDANLRSAPLSNFFGVDTAGSSVRKGVSVREQCLQVAENMWLAGTDVLAEDGATLPSAVRLVQRFAELRAAFDFLLIDAPGAIDSGDAAVLGQVSDGTVLVIDAERTRRIAARKVKETFDASRVRLLGAVLYNRSFPIPRGIYNRL